MAKRSYFDSWRQNNTKSPRLGESAAAAATASTASAPTAQSMERDEEGDRDDEPQAADSTSANTSASASTSTAILATSTSTFQKRPLSSSSSSSSSSYSVYDELNARDDQDAPTAVLDAAKELRRRIHEGVEDGTGLVIHRFHIRKRGDEDKQKKRRGRPGKKDDHADWCVHCDVCDGRPTSILPSYHSNSPLYGFEQQHLNSQTHEKHGNAILSSVASVEETAALDDAAADAARGLARGDATASVAARLATQVPGASLQRRADGDLVCAELALTPGGASGLLGISLEARSCALAGGL